MRRCFAQRKYRVVGRVWSSNGDSHAGACCFARLSGSNIGAIDWASLRRTTNQIASVGRGLDHYLLGHHVVGVLFLFTSTAKPKTSLGIFNSVGGFRQCSVHARVVVFDVFGNVSRKSRQQYCETVQKPSELHEKCVGSNQQYEGGKQQCPPCWISATRSKPNFPRHGK